MEALAPISLRLKKIKECQLLKRPVNNGSKNQGNQPRGFGTLKPSKIQLPLQYGSPMVESAAVF